MKQRLDARASIQVVVAGIRSAAGASSHGRDVTARAARFRLVNGDLELDVNLFVLSQEFLYQIDANGNSSILGKRDEALGS